MTKLQIVAQVNNTDPQIEFLRSLKKVNPQIYQKVADYLNDIRMQLSEDDIKTLLKV